MLSAFLFLTACAPAQTGFIRLKGAADHLDIPIYAGTPPVIYTRVPLGQVSGKAGPANTPSEQKYRALYNLSQAAREKGANAIIEVVGASEADAFVYSGEAVVFDLWPPDHTGPAPDAADLRMPKDPRRGD